MNRLWITISRLLIVTVVSATLSGSIVQAETELSGNIGIDLRHLWFDNQVRDGSTPSYTTSRALSNHFINLNLMGPLASPAFANYSLTGQFTGRYVQSSADGDTKNKYLDPFLSQYNGVLSLFPERPFPVQLYKSRSRDRTLRYESGNRSLESLVQPNVVVLRRYAGESDTKGGTMQVAISERLTLMAMTSKQTSEQFREYDFGENRDIWVRVTDDPANYLSERHTILLTNSIEDASMRVLIGDDVDITIPPSSDIAVDVDSGFQNVDIIPLTLYNQYRFQTNVYANSHWEIVFEGPPGSNDQQLETTSTGVTLQYEGAGRFSNELAFNHNGSVTPLSNITISSDNFLNTATYDVTRTGRLTLLTTMNENEQITDTLTPQLSSSFSHSSTYSFGRKNGFRMETTQGYEKSTTEDGPVISESTLNSFTNQIDYPSRRLNHMLTVKSSASFQRDNQGLSINQYGTECSNAIELRKSGIDFRPENNTKYTISDQTTSTGFQETLKTLETRFDLAASRKRVKYLGTVKMAGDYEYRRSAVPTSSDIIKRYGFSISAARVFSPRLSVQVQNSYRWETYGGSTETAGTGDRQASSLKPGKYSSAYSLGFSANPFSDFKWVVNLNVAPGSPSSTQKFASLLTWTVPIIKGKLKSIYSKETRDLADLPTQIQSDLKTTLGIRFRQITLNMEHIFAQEDLVANKFSFHEVTVRVARAFGVF